MADGESLLFDNEGDESPDQASGDVIFVIRTLPHPVFTRKGDDLFIKKTITLKEALLGFEFKLKHLDDRSISIKRDNVVTQSGSFLNFYLQLIDILLTEEYL